MTNNVSTEGLNGIALEIVNTINSLNSSIDNIKECSNNIKVECEKLKYYDKQRVSGSTSIQKQYFESGENKGEYKNTLVTYKIWQIEGQEELGENCRTLEQQLEEAKESISLLKLETEDIELIADTIDNYIMSIQEELGENIDTSILASAFGTLSSTIAFDSYNASTGNFVSTKHLLTEYWTDKTLRFAKNDNGTYTIYQKDENGNEVAMGYTTALTAALYMKDLNSKLNVKDEPVSTTTQKNDGTVLKQSDTKYTTSNKVSEETQKEIMQYTDADILGTEDKQEVYNNMSEEAKAIIDGKTVVLSPTKDLDTIIDKELDIVIPENANIKINNSSIIGGGEMVFKYDAEQGVYRPENSARIGSATYTKAEMSTLKITETKK